MRISMNCERVYVSNAYGVDFGCCFTCNGNAKALKRGTATNSALFLYLSPNIQPTIST